MTPDSPRSPETEAQPLCNCGPCRREAAERNAPIPYLRRHVAEAIYDGLGIYNRPDADRAADLVVAMLRPELERITFERDAAQATADNIAQQLEDLRDDVLGDNSLHVLEVASAAGREVERLRETARLNAKFTDAEWAAKVAEVERLTAEVRRLTESRDRGIWLTRDLTDERDEWKQSAEAEAGLLDQANAEHKAEVSRLREQLAAPLPSDLVERAAIWLFRAKTSRLKQEDAAYAQRTWDDLLDVRDTDAWKRYAAAMLADLGWGVSSSEVEAPQPQEMEQHKVVVVEAGLTAYVAGCTTCRRSVAGSKKVAEDWKDQHEADTLVPQVESPNRQANQQTACSICGSTEIQYQPFSGGKEYYCPSCEDVYPYDEGRAPRRAQMLRDGKFGELKQEMRDHFEGRPSGSERLAPQSDGDSIDWAPYYEAAREQRDQWRETCEEAEQRNIQLLALVTDLFSDVRHAMKKYAELVEATPEHVLDLADYQAAQRQHDQKDAAQAARSEATPEEPRTWRKGDPEPGMDVTAVRHSNSQVFTRRPWPVRYGQRNATTVWQAGPAGAPCSWEYLTEQLCKGDYVLTEVLSPSIRKEGGDTTPSVSSQEETEGETDG